MSDIRGNIRGMLQKGQDPKDYLIEICRPQCTSLQQKLQRCETALKNMTHADPELSCMYPLRDWVTCVDGCVSNEVNIGSAHDSCRTCRKREWIHFLIRQYITNHILLTVLHCLNKQSS